MWSDQLIIKEAIVHFLTFMYVYYFLPQLLQFGFLSKIALLDYKRTINLI